MSPNTAGKRVRNGASQGRKRYDKELVRDKTLELLAARLGPGKDQGARLVWDCPGCKKQQKYSVKKAEGKGGCLVEGCRFSGYDDVFGMLARLEDLDYHADFLAVLARAYELLGLKPAGERAETPAKAGTPEESASGSVPAEFSSKAAPRAVPVPRRAAALENGATRGGDESSKDFDARLALAARVYGRILELSPLETRDRRYLRTRGLSYATIKEGRFGTMTAGRARHLKGVLQREFGREALLSVPGFSEDPEDGRLKFTLTGDYVLIPYHDAESSVTTIEGRCVGEPPEGMGKYVSLRRAGNHLYLFPGHRPEDILAVCEGAMGAIVAAECGLAVGAVQGCERFRASSSPEMLDGDPGAPLLELRGVDFGGRTVPYIPDADDPPIPNVLRAAPKAARWIAEPQNGRAAICLLPRGADLDEWLLSMSADERTERFAELLAGANPPEDGAKLSSDTISARRSEAASHPPSPEGTDAADATTGRIATRDEAPPQLERGARSGSEDGMFRLPSMADANREGTPKKGRRVPIAEDAVSQTAPASAPRKRKAIAGEKSDHKDRGSPTPQPGLWNEASPPGAHAEAETGRDNHDNRRGVSRGARKLRDEVYRAMIEVLPLKEEHLGALAKRGVMPATVRVGRFASLDEGRAQRMASDLTARFGAKKLLSVPGFEPNSAGKVRLPLASDRAGEHVLVPCFDAEGLLAGVEALAFDHETGEIDAEETVPLKGAGSHLYVFAHYEPGQVEGFCEGPLGAMLAAQEDVVIGAIGGFRRHKAASGPAEGRQRVDAVLPELEGVDFDGRPVAYVPRAGSTIGEPNARYQEATRAARHLVERQNGRAAVVSLGGDKEFGEHDGGPTSLGEWILSLPEDVAHDRLRELFPESPARGGTMHESEYYGEEADHNEEDLPPTLPTKIIYGTLALATVVAVFVDSLILRIDAFSQHTSVGPNGEPVLYAGALGPFRRLADSAPFDLLYQLHAPVALVAALALTFVLTTRAHRRQLARLKASQMHLEESWELHLTPGETASSRVPITLGEALSAALIWPVAFVLVGWIITASEASLSFATRLRMTPEMGALVADPTLASICTATLLSAFILWRRRSFRAAESRMLRGEIRH